jgi:hypothetical protein
LTAPGFDWAPFGGDLMPDVTVPVLKPLDYQGRSYVRGDSVTMRAIDAAAAARAGKVSIAKSSKAAGTYATTAMTAEAPAVPEPSGRRRRGGRGKYQRRDLRANVTTPAE